MIEIDVGDVIRDILGSARVQLLSLPRLCTNPEASALDSQFREQLYEEFDYAAFAASMMALVPEDNAIDCKDDFGLHYLIFPGRDREQGRFCFGGPFLYHARGEEQLRELLDRRGLSPAAMDALQWFFGRVPVIPDVNAWRRMHTILLSRYLGNPDLSIEPASLTHAQGGKEKPAAAFGSIPYSVIEARYEAETKMLDAIRRGDISEATYYQNLFRSYALEQRVADPLRNAKNMVIAASTAMRKAVQQAEVHPLYIDDLSGRLMQEIEAAENEQQAEALVPRMIRHYCLLVQTYSRERYSGVVRNVLNFVDFHYMEPLSLESLALKYAVNKNYLSTLFSREVGMPLTEYINLTRVRRSLKLLSSTTLSMQEVAERVGFSDANYYTRTFKKLHGTTPNMYRRSFKAE